MLPAQLTALGAGSTLLSLFTVPHSKKRKRDSDQQQQQCHETLHNGKQIPFPPDHYRLTLEQMESNNYPLPDIDDEGHMTCPAGFVATQPAGVNVQQICAAKLDLAQVCISSMSALRTQCNATVDGQAPTWLLENPLFLQYGQRFVQLLPQ